MAGLNEACDGPHKQAACLKRRRQGRTLDRHGGGVGSLEGPPVDLRVGLLPLRLSVCLCLPVCLSRSPSRSLSLSLVTAPGVAVTPPPPCHLRRCVRPVRPAERGRASSAPGAERSGGPRRNGGANLTTGSDGHGGSDSEGVYDSDAFQLLAEQPRRLLKANLTTGRLRRAALAAAPGPGPSGQ